MAINIFPEQDELISGWKESHGYTFPVLTVTDTDRVMEQYGLVATPESFLLDGERRIVYRHTGYSPGDEEELEAQIREHLGLD